MKILTIEQYHTVVDKLRWGAIEQFNYDHEIFISRYQHIRSARFNLDKKYYLDCHYIRRGQPERVEYDHLILYYKTRSIRTCHLPNRTTREEFEIAVNALIDLYLMELKDPVLTSIALMRT